jgi:hypothetical protein
MNLLADKKPATLASANIRTLANQAVARTTAIFPQSDMASALGLLFPEPGKLSAQNSKQFILIATLTRALRTERRLARAGHWAYDINRHIALSQSLRTARGDAAIQNGRHLS